MSAQDRTFGVRKNETSVRSNQQISSSTLALDPIDNVLDGAERGRIETPEPDCVGFASDFTEIRPGVYAYRHILPGAPFNPYQQARVQLQYVPLPYWFAQVSPPAGAPAQASPPPGSPPAWLQDAVRWAFRTFFGGPAINVLKPPIPWIYLRLRFRDPEGIIRDFPPNYPVKVRFGDGATAQTVTPPPAIQPGGRLTFKARTANPWQFFTLDFTAGGIPYIVCEPMGSPPASPPKFSLTGGLPALTNHGQRYFSLPRHWELRQADWSPPPAFVGNGRFEAPTGRVYHTLSPPNDISIGTAADPVVLTLEPHWHFARFEYYDRYFGNAHLDSPPRPAHRKRISIPPIPLDAFRNNPNVAGADPDTHTRWTIDLGSQSLLQAFPMILRRDAGGVELSPPDGAHLGLRFQTAANTVVFSRTDQVRILAASPPPAIPGPDRLRYYDLPQMWKSTKYYVRRTVSSPPAPGKFINTATVDEIAQAQAQDSPLVFCLDDLVMRIGNPAAGTVAGPPASPPARVALFNHRFDDKLADSSFHGVYKMLSPPPSPPTDVPASDVTITDHYIFDYPDWTRLAIAQGNLFDVFNKRTPDVPGRVVGARAAVRWVDTTAPFPGVSVWAGSPLAELPDHLPLPGRMLWGGVGGAGRPPVTSVPSAHPFYAHQPFFQVKMPDRYTTKFTTAGDGDQIGRVDLALLRCCDVFQGDEVAINLHYLKSAYNFNYSPPSPPGRARSALAPGDRPVYAQNMSINVAKRWDGADPGVSISRALFRPRAAAPRLRIPSVWFSQSVQESRAHFRLDLVGGKGRDFRNANWGTGETGDTSYLSSPPPDYWFTAAHESGHMDGLPDEYNERWDGASYKRRSFKSNLFGDPYEMDFGPSPPGSVAIMNGNRRVRNRHFWHAAEWCHQITGTPFQVDYTDASGIRYPDYWLPSHSDPQRNFYSWPLDAHLSPPPGRRMDWFLYALGKEDFTANPATLRSASLANPFDGILVLVIHFGCELQADRDIVIESDTRSRLLGVLSFAISQGMNNRFYATGSVAGRTFHRCLIHFAPQFLVLNHPFVGSPPRTSPPDYSEVDATLYKGAQSLDSIYGISYRIHVWTTAATVSPPTWNVPRHRLVMNVASDADLDIQFNQWFPRFFGLPGDMGSVTVANMQTIVRAVYPTFTVHPLP